MIRKTVHYSGRVQGVGFRYTAHRLASRYPVTGHVRNLPDGRVELVVEGDEEQVDRLLSDVADRMGDHIERTDVVGDEIDQPAATAFEVRY